LRRLTGEKRAFELVATGRQVSAREAFDLGLVSRVVPGAEFDAAVAHLAAELAALPADALRATKRLFYDLDGLPVDDGLSLAAQVNVEARFTSAFRDAVRRYAPRDTRA
ncbi:MAG TPA: enoyl-CoA hydratase-related protein, partial [Gemmatimonadaceae bacterium]